MKFLLPALVIILFLSLPAAFSQQKIASESKRDKEKRAQTDPWAEFEDEVDSIHRWDFGLNFGAYFPNNYSANFYNGMPGNVNNVDYVLSNPWWYQEIKETLGATDTFFVTGYSTGMRYQVAFTGGLFLRFNFNRKNGIFLEANYTQLKTSGPVTLEVDPASYPTYEDLRTEGVAGKEARVLIDLGYQRSFPLLSKIYFFLQAGALMSYSRVLQSVLVIEGREYNLVNVYGSQGYIPNTNSQSFNITQQAFGFGPYLGLGAGIPLNDLFGVEPGCSFQYYPVNLEGYSNWKPSWSIYLRILLGAGHAKN